MRRIIDSIFGWILATVVVFEILYIFYGLVFYPTSIFKFGSLPLFLLAPLPNPIILLTFISGVALLAYILSVSVIVSASASYSFFGCSECRRGLARLMGVIAAFSMLEAVIRLFFERFPNPMEGMETWKIWMYLLNASFYEEVVSRVLLIGVPVALLSIRDRGWYKLILGQIPEDRRGPLLWIFVAISSITFGYAHVPGWGLLKLISAIPAGVALSLAFVYYGIWASIALHFAVDFMSAMMTGPHGSIFTIPFGILLVAFAGYGIYVILASLVSRLGKPKAVRRRVVRVRACPSCGGVRFLYLGEGLYRCLDCGRVLGEEEFVIKEIVVE